MVDRSGQQLGHYKLIRLIGRGGFADVYLAQNLNLGSFCAIKVLRTPLIRKGRRLFLREARLAARLDNEHIIRVLDASSHNGTPFIVMSYAPNGSLRDRHPRGKPAPFDVILSYLEQIAEALDYLNAHNLIHMDVKPENLLLGRNFEVLLSDFGIAKSIHRASGSAPGTLHYMSPEHLRGSPSPASDQYALAVCAYKWLTGYLPFDGTPAQIKLQQLHERPVSLRALAADIPPAMEKVVLRALSKDPQRRYSNVGAFVDAFRGTIPDALPPATALSVAQVGWLKLRRWIASCRKWLLTRLQ
jgi:eukaryotic-like serine/threonine-protein kinase